MSADIIDLRLAEATAAVRGLAKDHSAAELRRRVELAEQQDWTCPWCGMPLFPSDIGAGQTDVDHVIPLARGGPRELWNRELLHSKCNRAKGRQWSAYATAAHSGLKAVPADPAGTAGRLLEPLPELTGDPAAIDPACGGVVDVPDQFAAADLEAAARTGDPVLAATVWAASESVTIVLPTPPF